MFRYTLNTVSKSGIPTHMHSIVIGEVLLEVSHVQEDPLPGLPALRVRGQRHVVEVELAVVEVVVGLVGAAEARPPDGAGAARRAPVELWERDSFNLL